MTVSLYLVSGICDDLCVSPLQQVKNRCEPDVSPWSAVTFDLISSLPATDTLKGHAWASRAGWSLHMKILHSLTALCLCAMHVYAAEITLCVKVLPLLALQHWGSINNSATHSRTQLHTLQSCLSPTLLPDFLSIYPSPAWLFLCPLFVSLSPSPSRSLLPTFFLLFLVMFPLLKLRNCQTSHIFVHSLLSIFLHPFCFLYSHSPIRHSWAACTSTPSFPSLFFSFFNLYFWGAGEEAVEGRKGCGRPHCSTLLCCSDTDMSFSLTHTHYWQNRTHTLCGVTDPLYALLWLERSFPLVSQTLWS